MRELQIYIGGSEDMHVFCGFNERMMAKSPRTNSLGPKRIAYNNYRRFLSLGFSGVLGISVDVFR